MPPQGLLSSGIIPGLLPFPLPHFRATASLNEGGLRMIGLFQKFYFRQNAENNPQRFSRFLNYR